ncbi:MAG: sodium-dependent transporter [Muribaculum sp.]|nr:sodium-dependent transporter [Muribaculum sp.]
MSQKNQFASRIGLIAATVGSAVGLGNVWRFPAETQVNGGAAFLLLYVICIFLFGIPVMLCEFSLGRGTHSDSIGAFKALSPSRPWWLVGLLAIVASFLILSYYMVVAGWTLEYLIQSVTGNLYDGTGGSSLDSQFASHMDEYVCSDWNPLIMTYIVIGLNLIILLRGVQKGIEKMSNVLMPLLFILLVIFCCVALSLPKAMEGLQFFFHPDFSQITPAVVVNALGQAFFSLSLGMGILITYSGYFSRKTNLTTTAATVSMLDMLVSVMMGVIIFPAVMSFGLESHQLEGSALVFITLPEVFSAMPATQLWSSLFFLLLLIAALTSTLSLSEVAVSYIINRFDVSRVKACVYFVIPLTLLSTLCSLSQGSLSWLTICGKDIFAFLDATTTNIMLPVAAFLTCIYVGWFAPKNFFKQQINMPSRISPALSTMIWGIVRYVAPVLIIVIFVVNLL